MTTLRHTLDEATRHAIAARTQALFRSSGALREGHFVLKSGRHSDAYLEKFQVLQWPRETERLCAAIAVWAAQLDPRTVAGPTTGGIILAPEAARLEQQGSSSRWSDLRTIVEVLAARDELRANLDVEGATDIMWAFASPQTFVLLVRKRGWDTRRWGRWLGDTLARTLLADGESAGPDRGAGFRQVGGTWPAAVAG